MATATPTRRVLGYLDVVRPVLRSIDKLPAKSRPGLIGVILYMVLSMVVLKVLGKHEASYVIGILGIGGAIVVIATAGRYALRFVLVLLAFCFSIIFLNRMPALAPTVVDAQEPAPAAIKVAENGEKQAESDSALVSGNVRVHGTNAAVQGAFVDVEGYGAGLDTTDAKGYFEIRVPRGILKMRGDSVKLAVATAQVEFFVMPFQGRPFEIALTPPPAAPVAPAAPVTWIPSRAEGMAAFAGFRPGAPATGASFPGAQEGFRARLVLDSVKTLHDGSRSDTYWRFDVRVNDAPAITIRQRAYDRASGRNLLHLGGEVMVTLPQASRLSLHIRGLRDAFIGVHQINGYGLVEGESLRPEQPVHGEIAVHGDDPDKGDFVFYYTLVRRGTPTIRVNPAAAGATAAAELGGESRA